MKKTLIASAIAMAALSSSAFAEDNLASQLDEKLKMMPTIYGNVQLTTYYYDAEFSNINGVGGSDVSDSDYDFVDNGSTIGFKHEHEVSPGLTAFMKAEFEFNAAEKSGSSQGGGGGLGETDEAYLGLKGNFGSVWAGTNDSIYETWIEDTTDHFEFYGMTGLYAGDNMGNTEDRTTEYVTPSFGGLQLGVAYQMNGQANTTGAKERDNLIMGAKYALEGLTLAVVMGNNEAETDGTAAYGFAASYEMDAFRVGLTVETQEDYWTTSTLLGVYTMGANTFALSYSMGEEDGTGRNGETSVFTAQALHNMSDNFYVYVEAQFEDDNQITDYDGTGDVANVSASTLAFGATYAF